VWKERYACVGVEGMREKRKERKKKKRKKKRRGLLFKPLKD
jgi:hypothetical protein